MIKIEPAGPHGFEFAEFIDNYNNCSSTDSSSDDEEEAFEIDEDEIFDYTKPAAVKLENIDSSILLTEDEERVVARCTDPEIKELILLNRKKNTLLLETFEMFTNMLVDCEMAITEEEKVAEEAKKIRKKLNPKLWRLGFPYFKSVDDYPCPRNADIVKKEASGELYFYGLMPSRKWKRDDITKLIKGVSFWYKNIKTSELQMQIKKLKEKTKNTREEKMELKELQDKFEELEFNNEDFYPPLGEEKCLDWPRLAMHFFDDVFSAEDCEYFWKNYLHPSINKEAWTEEENEKIKHLAAVNKYQNWELIAEQLGSNRTGFIACLHFYSKVKPHRIQGTFSAEEDQLILELIDKYKQGSSIPWEKIVHYFPKRHRTQLYYRYTYYLKEDSRVKDKFTEAEDVLLLILVDRFGRKFSTFKKHFPLRSTTQLKSRYVGQLRQSKKKGAFTIEEDKEILSLVEKNGSNTWAYMHKLFHRNSTTIRQRYLTLKTFLKTNPGKGLEEAPRRVFFINSHSDARDTYLRLIANKFKIYNKIPTIEEIEELMEVKTQIIKPVQVHIPRAIEGVHSAPSTSQINKPVQGNGFSATFFPSLTIDALLADFFRSPLNIELNDNLIESATTTVQTILRTLQAKLKIPMNYRSDPRLDSIDVHILDKITKKLPKVDGQYVKHRAGDVQHLIPPNSNTLTALKCMLAQNGMYRMDAEGWPKNDKEVQLDWCMSKYMSNQDIVVQQKLKYERNMFTERFISLFKLPAILSKVRPHELLLNGIRKPVLKTYQRKFKPTPASIPETQLNPTPSTSGLLKLEPTIQFETVFVNDKPNIVDLIKPNHEHKMETDESEDPLSKLTVIEELKKNIVKTIDDLSRNPSNKKFFHHVTKCSHKQSAPGTSTTTDNNGTKQHLELSTKLEDPPTKKSKKN